MRKIDNRVHKYEFIRRREKEYLRRPMGKLEAKINQFFQTEGVCYHRQWLFKLGSRDKRQTRYLATFYLPEQRIILDVLDTTQADMSLYDYHRHKELVWGFGDQPQALAAVIPIDENLNWREVKKQLKVIVQTR